MTTSSIRQTDLPFLGFGLGLRPEHYETVLQEKPAVDWFELLSENYMVDGGKPLYYLDKICADYPVVMHGVSLSIGSTDALNQDYLLSLKKLADRVNPLWFSDHLCWTGVNGSNMHDLLPLPYTEEAIQHVADRISQVQDFIGRPMLIENVSSYVTYTSSQLSEWEFLTEVVTRADCRLLFDVNNIFVSGFNHDFDPLDFINGVPADRVAQIHLAGHTHHGDYIVDTHDHPVIDSVWDLYVAALQRFGPVSTMIERDDNIPELFELLAELETARTLAAGVIGEELTQKKPVKSHAGAQAA